MVKEPAITTEIVMLSSVARLSNYLEGIKLRKQEKIMYSKEEIKADVTASDALFVCF